MKKKCISVILTCLMLSVCVGAYADEMYTVTQKPITVTYNGEDISFPDALPQIQDGRTLVPVRAIMERAQMQVEFEPASRTVKAQKDDLVITMTVDDASATVQKGDAVETVTLDVPARIIDERTYVPIRFIGESMDTKVNWNAAGREVVIIDTAEWEKTLKEHASLMDTLLHQSLKEKPATAGTTGADFTLSYAFKNVKDETGQPIKLNFDVKLTLTGTDVYDGTNSGSYIAIDTDLSFLKQLYAAVGEDYDEEMLKKFAKPYTIDLDVIVDASGNLYCKSKALVSILKDADQTAAAEMIGDNYIKLSLADLFNGSVSSDGLAAAIEAADSIWDVIENLVENDDMLYSQSAEQLNAWIDMYVQMYNDDLFKVTKQRDGSELWQYQLDKETYVRVIADMLTAREAERGASAEETEIIQTVYSEMLSAMDVDLTMDLTMKDGVPTKVDYRYKLDMEMPVDDDGGAISVQFAGKFSTVERAFDAKKDKKVTIPTNTVDLADVLGVNQLILMPEEA